MSNAKILAIISPQGPDFLYICTQKCENFLMFQLRCLELFTLYYVLIFISSIQRWPLTASFHSCNKDFFMTSLMET